MNLRKLITLSVATITLSGFGATLGETITTTNVSAKKVQFTPHFKLGLPAQFTSKAGWVSDVQKSGKDTFRTFYLKTDNNTYQQYYLSLDKDGNPKQAALIQTYKFKYSQHYGKVYFISSTKKYLQEVIQVQFNGNSMIEKDLVTYGKDSPMKHSVTYTGYDNVKDLSNATGTDIR